MNDVGEALARSRWDPDYFAREVLGLTKGLHPGQQKMFRAYLKRSRRWPWRALYLWLMVSAGNRAGKTLALAVIVLHSCLFKMGLQLPDSMEEKDVARWRKLAYHWWHFAIEQGPSELVYTEITRILEGTHLAQQNGCPLSEAVGGATAIALWDVKERGEYVWIRFTEAFGGAEIHFRSTKQKALGALGQDMHGVSFDEVGLEPKVDYILNEVLHFRRLGTGGQFILISTPSEDVGPMWADLWYTGDPEQPDRQPGRFSMRMSSRDNVGFGLDRHVFEQMIAGVAENIIRQNIDGEFIQGTSAYFNAMAVRAIFKEDLPEHQDAIKRHVYVHGADPGLKDRCWSIVCDILPDGTVRGVHCEFHRGKQTTRQIVAMTSRNHLAYDDRSSCETGVDSTGLGGHMFLDLVREQVPGARGIEFGGMTKVKRDLLGDLRTLIDEGRLELPATGPWLDVKAQLLGYKLLDRKLEQDAVATLMVIAKLVRLCPGPGVDVSAPFDIYSTGGSVMSRGERWLNSPY